MFSRVCIDWSVDLIPGLYGAFVRAAYTSARSGLLLAEPRRRATRPERVTYALMGCLPSGVSHPRVRHFQRTYRRLQRVRRALSEHQSKPTGSM